MPAKYLSIATTAKKLFFALLVLRVVFPVYHSHCLFHLTSIFQHCLLYTVSNCNGLLLLCTSCAAMCRQVLTMAKKDVQVAGGIAVLVNE